MATQTQINRYNRRIRSLGKRNFEFRSEHFRTQFSKIIRNAKIGTENIEGSGKVSGMISAKEFNQLDIKKQNKLVKQLDALMEQSTVKSMKENFSGTKEVMKKVFADRGINIDSLSVEQYTDLWDKIQEMSKKFTGERYSSDQDEEQNILESVTDLFKQYQNDNIDYDTLNDIFDRLLDESNSSDALNLLYDIENELYNLG